MSSTLIQTPLGFGGTSLLLDPLGFAPSGATPALPSVNKIYWNGTNVQNLKVTDGSSTVKSVIQVYYG
jgi:hypothetical protein